MTRDLEDRTRDIERLALLGGALLAANLNSGCDMGEGTIDSGAHHDRLMYDTTEANDTAQKDSIQAHEEVLRQETGLTYEKTPYNTDF